MALGTIIRPFGNFRTELVKTKTGENQLPGQVLAWDITNKYYELPANNESNARCAVVVNTETNVDKGAANVNIDGIREVLEMEWEVVVKTTTAVNVGDYLKYSATVPGEVAKYDPAVDTDGNKIVGICVKLESEEHYDVTKTLTNPGAGTNIIMRKFAPRALVDTA
jgi:hypothetical protein